MFTKDFVTLRNIFRIAFWQKTSVLIFLFSSFVATIAEVIFLGLLYTLFSEEKKNMLLNWLTNNLYFLHPVQVSFIERNFLYVVIFLAIIMLFLRLISAVYSRFSMADIQVKTGTKLSHKLLSCFLDAHPIAWLSWKKEKITHIITYEAAASGECIYAVMNMLMSLIIMSGLLIAAYIISAKLTLFSLTIGTGVLVINYANYLKIRKLGILKVKTRTHLLGHIYDVVFGHKVFKLEGGENFAKIKLSDIITDSYSWLLKKAKNINLIMSFTELFIYFLFFGLIIIAHIFRIVDWAVILTLLVISMRIQESIRDLQTQWMHYQELLPNFLDVQKMLSYADRYITKKKEIAPQEINKETAGLTLRMDMVSFSYSDTKVILRELSIIFRRGDKILVKGNSGVGKSTLINLLCGILEPNSGKIYFEDEELTRQSFFHLRNYIGYSSPEAYIFRGTIKDNISLGLNSTEDEISDAVRKAGLEELVKRLERDILSQLIDNAANISLGERQRLMLARMFLKKPRLILLDETTSNLDLELEDKILKNLVENLPYSTLIMVTHRAPNNFPFDKKYELKDGRLISID